MEMLTSTVAPESWETNSGQGVLRPNETTLSLVVRQTLQVHEEIGDLLQQLRRLQDLQVTVEVRFITVSDRFFEYIGVDFDFDIQDTLGGPPGPGFGTNTSQTGATTGGNQAGTTGTAGAAGAATGWCFRRERDGGFHQYRHHGPGRDLRDYDSYRSGTVVGRDRRTETSPATWTFRSSRVRSAVGDTRPSATSTPTAGATLGFAVLSDIEAFFFIQATQQDNRSNLMFAPKVTLFNGQQASVS